MAVNAEDGIRLILTNSDELNDPFDSELEWPRLSCSEANQLSLEFGNLKLDSQRDIVFQDNGQLRSSDNNHKLAFDTTNNVLELHELGDIRFLTGSPTPSEKLRIRANGNVGIGTDTPSQTLEVNGAIAATNLTVTDNANISGNLKIDGNLEVMGDVTARDVEHVSGNVSFGDADNDEVKITGVLRSGHSSGALQIDDDLHTTGSLNINGNVGIGTASPQALLDIIPPDLSAKPWLRLGLGDDSGRVWLEYPQPGSGHSRAPNFILSDLDDAPRIRFQQIGTGTEANPEFGSWIGHAKGRSNDLTIMGGNVGIGTTTPGTKLDIAGGALNLRNPGQGNVLAFLNTERHWQLRQFGTGAGTALELASVGGGGNKNLLINTTGRVGIGTTSPSYKLHVNGSAAKPGGGSWTNSSDARLKKNVEPLSGILDKLLKLRGVSYEWKEPEKQGDLTGKQIGMIAQEVEPVFPEWVGTDLEGYKDLTFRGFEALTVEAFRELQLENKILKLKYQELEARTKSLEELVGKQKGHLRA